jgi:membrane protease YdiL (CAAX protease family)
MKLKGIFSNTGTGTKMLLLLGVSLLSFLLFSFLSVLIIGKDTYQVGNLRIAQILQSLGLFVLPPFILMYLLNEKPFEWFGLKKLPASNLWMTGIGAVIFSVPLVNYLVQINNAVVFPESMTFLENSLRAMENSAEVLTEKLLQTDSVFGLTGNLLLIALMPAFAEELFFRGTMQKILAGKTGQHVAVWITAIIFSLFHMQFFGFLPRLMLGAVLGYLYMFSGNLWLPVIAHFANNAIAVIFHFMIKNGITTLDPEVPGKEGTGYLAVFSLIALAMLLFILKKKSRN